jgi:hypothetical protein
MNWGRAKTLLIVLLLLVNLILGGRLLYREVQVRTLEGRAMEDLTALLGKNGLTAEAYQIPAALELTYDVVQSEDGRDPELPSVRGLPVWGMASGSAQIGLLFTQVTGEWLWSGALPINNRQCFSAGYALLQLTSDWGRTGVLESAELGFAAMPIAPDVLRLRPCWRFVISGEEFYVLAV